MNIPQIPFIQNGDKIELTSPVFLSCGCGGVTARWATIQQNLVTKIPQAKPKASRIVSDWIRQNDLKNKWPLLTKHQYGIVAGETADGFKMVDIMSGATSIVINQIAQLVKEDNEYRSNH